jgi:hypothetical protein
MKDNKRKTMKEFMPWFIVIIGIGSLLGLISLRMLRPKIVGIEEIKKLSGFSSCKIILDDAPESSIENPLIEEGTLKYQFTKEYHKKIFPPVDDTTPLGKFVDAIQNAERIEHSVPISFPYFICFKLNDKFYCLRANIIPEERIIVGENWQSKEAYEELVKIVGEIPIVKIINVPFDANDNEAKWDFLRKPPERDVKDVNIN